MSKQKPTTTVINGAAMIPTTTTITNANNRAAAVLPRPVRRVLQNFLLVWLDANLDESKDDFKKSLRRLRRVVATIETFTDAQECINFLNEIKKEKVFLIVSDSLGQQIVPKIEEWPQLESVYVLCHNQVVHEQWVNKISKVKGVHTKIKSIRKALQIDRENCDRDLISISFNGIDPSFMYTQLLKEALLEIDDDDRESIKDLVDYCREQNDISDGEIHKIKHEYYHHTPIWWYTSPYFMYSMLNRGLRLMDVDIIMKMDFFIRHLHQHIDKLYREQQQSSTKATVPFNVFRGQGLSLENFEKMKQTKGGLMSFNNFLSTGENLQASLKFARDRAAKNSDMVGILFIMTIDPMLCSKSSISYVDISKEGYFKDKEAEILFTTHTIFCIDQIQQIQHDHTDRLWEVKLTLVGNDNHQLNTLNAHIRQELGWRTGWSRLGDIFIKLGEPAKAEKLYQILLAKASSDEHRADYNNQLGQIYYNIGELSKSVSFFQRSLEINEKILSPNHPDLAAFYSNIANVFVNMGEYSKALLSYERSLEILKRALLPIHPLLATTYNNIGNVYVNMGEYRKALSSYKRSLEILKIALPANHPLLATSYNNIGLVYNNMGEYSKVLAAHKRALEILKIALPPNHPYLAAFYSSIGAVYYKMGEYSKALSSHKRALEIWKTTLPPNHPDLAASYSNTGNVYINMGEYTKALSLYERSLEILKRALPPNHLLLAISYNNIGLVYVNMGEYRKALSSYERSLEIQKVALPPNHPLLPTSYNSIGLVYNNMGKYSKALECYEKALRIYRKSLPPGHPDMVLTENNIVLVKKKM